MEEREIFCDSASNHFLSTMFVMGSIQLPFPGGRYRLFSGHFGLSLDTNVMSAMHKDM